MITNLVKNNQGQRIYNNCHNFVGAIVDNGFFTQAKSTFGIDFYNAICLTQDDGWCIDLNIFDEIRKSGASFIEILDIDTGKVYLISVLKLWIEGVRHPWFPPKISRRLEFWEISKQEEPGNGGL